MKGRGTHQWHVEHVDIGAVEHSGRTPEGSSQEGSTGSYRLLGQARGTGRKDHLAPQVARSAPAAAAAAAAWGTAGRRAAASWWTC